MNENDINISELLSELTPFCSLHRRVTDKNDFTVYHEYLTPTRHRISVNSDNSFMLHRDLYGNNKILLPKDTLIKLVKQSVTDSLNDTISGIISDLQRRLLERTINATEIKATKFGPFSITKVDVKQVDAVDETFTRGVYTVKLSISIYDSFLFYKKVRYTYPITIIFDKNNINVAINSDQIEMYGVADNSSCVDVIIMDLIAIAINLQ